MKIGIIDADLIGRKRHRFPNLACMKISGYHKSKGDEVVLLESYDNIDEYDKIYISKVFLDTIVPLSKEKLNDSRITYGGTGFFYDKAKPLNNEVEHCKPDYDLYLNWVIRELEKGKRRQEFEYYLDYSIGFMTRGCFRKCEFCVNKNSTKVVKHSGVAEFLDNSKKYICLLDDNILGYPKWKEVFEELNETGKPFQFKQGMDERILTEEKCEVLSKSKYKGDYIFAFDNINDKEVIENKLQLLRKYTDKKAKFYVFCGYDRDDKWDENFWKNDLIDIFERLKIITKYKSIPYLMRFERYKESPHSGIYIALSAWCNQPSVFTKLTFEDFCIKKGIRWSVYHKYKDNPSKYIEDGLPKGASWRSLDEFKAQYPDIAERYFNIRFDIYQDNEDYK